MVARSLKHYPNTLVSGAYLTCMPAVGSGRALVISKMLIAHEGGTGTYYMAIVPLALAQGATTASFSASHAGHINRGLTLNNGETYSELGMVLLPTEQLHVYTTLPAGANAFCNIFGEEVDN